MCPLPHDDGQATVIHPTASPHAERTQRSFVLRVVAGPDAGKTLVVDPTGAGRVLLGQSPACTLRLDDRSVSRRHAALDPEQGALHLYDLGSTNGTFVNGIRALDVVLATRAKRWSRPRRRGSPGHPPSPPCRSACR